MQFESANPSVVRSVRQRDVLNAWLRALGKGRALPAGQRASDEVIELS